MNYKTTIDLASLYTQVRVNLTDEILGKWYPAAVDTVHGGFLEDFSEDWQAGPDNWRSTVYQSRLTWVAAAASRFDDEKRGYYQRIAKHGIEFLAGRLWDKRDGGFFWATAPGGEPMPFNASGKPAHKLAYGIAFGIYAASEAYRATADPDALSLAKRAYLWLDGHAHDPDHGGYFEALGRDGAPIPAPTGETTGMLAKDEIGTTFGDKSMNAHIHLLEAFTNLYSIWPDAALKVRLAEMLAIVRDRVALSDGYLGLYFRPDWTADDDLDSYGHDVETAYLLIEAASVLGIGNDTDTLNAARRLVDHALLYGYDSKYGGFYSAGKPGLPCGPTRKIWWEQAEGLNALLLMHELYAQDTDIYWNAFLSQWRFIAEHQVDACNGGWFPTVRADGSSIPGLHKSDAWTDPYHQGRALMNVCASLKRLAEKR